jgi:hypothetical protein
MSSDCESIMWAGRSALTDRTSSAKAEGGSIGSGFISRIGHVSACVFVEHCLSTSLGS